MEAKKNIITNIVEEISGKIEETIYSIIENYKLKITSDNYKNFIGNLEWLFIVDYSKSGINQYKLLNLKNLPDNTQEHILERVANNWFVYAYSINDAQILEKLKGLLKTLKELKRDTPNFIQQVLEKHRKDKKLIHYKRENNLSI